MLNIFQAQLIQDLTYKHRNSVCGKTRHGCISLFQVPAHGKGSWNQMTFKIPPKQHHSVILQFYKTPLMLTSHQKITDLFYVRETHG